jgi:hypothetical protein
MNYLKELIDLNICKNIYKFIDFGFAELRFASVLRLPLPQGERRTESRFIGASSTQSKSIYCRVLGMGQKN